MRKQNAHQYQENKMHTNTTDIQKMVLWKIYDTKPDILLTQLLRSENKQLKQSWSVKMYHMYLHSASLPDWKTADYFLFILQTRSLRPSHSDLCPSVHLSPVQVTRFFINTAAFCSPSLQTEQLVLINDFPKTVMYKKKDEM